MLKQLGVHFAALAVDGAGWAIMKQFWVSHALQSIGLLWSPPDFKVFHKNGSARLHCEWPDTIFRTKSCWMQHFCYRTEGLTENDGHEIGGQDIQVYRLKIDYITMQCAILFKTTAEWEYKSQQRSKLYRPPVIVE